MKKVGKAAAPAFPLLAAAAAMAVIMIISNSATTSEAARVFKVGDDFGWQEPTSNNSQLYAQWATTNRFQVGDSLLFEYKNDSVAEVDKWGYYHCNTSTATAVFDNGRSSFKLEQPGPFYFISGNFNHCNNGQLLVVEVMSMYHHEHPHHPSLPPQPAFPPAYAYPPQGSSSSSSMVPSSSESHQPSSAVIMSVIVSCVTVVLIATFVALFLCAP
ncbi:unnamed protein product [Linum trigynum]|uniref:Phytocyanin domain-containing protein n=1 Tax=Linum trigynum TaxID=586398 RepID=A0AAV2DX48_9ROSI